jgi:C_GCAxxG_C_C family probable redox protein
MDKSEQAAEYMKSGYNCAQSIVKAFAREVGISNEEEAVRMAASLGGGIGRNGYVCGALTGAALVLGRKVGYIEPSDAAAREKTYAAVSRLLEAFRKEYGTVMCGELLGIDMKNPEQLARARENGVFQKQCPGYVLAAGRILEEILASE